MKPSTKFPAPLTADEIAQVIVAILLSAIVAHYMVQGVILGLGGRPRIDDFHSLLMNGAITSLFLLIGWMVRQIFLLSLVYLGLSMSFLVPYFFVLHGPWNTWLMQISLHAGLPLISGGLLIFAIRRLGVPMRPKRERRLHRA